MNSTTASSTSVRAQRHPLTTAKSLFFLAALLSCALSIWLWFSGDRERGLFVGLWVPSILSAGNLLLTGSSRD